jgi:FtsP/CotA-like multicopper oxidase with cupredoxin domain
MVRRLGCIGLLMLSAIMALADNLQLPLVEANDNRTPAGRLNHDVLDVRLELRQGRWFPEEDNGPYRDIYAFAEEGRAAQTPGPLIRVPSGTTIYATIRNKLPSTAKVFGLHQHPGNSKESFTLQAGEVREIQFVAGEPGTYLYWATTSNRAGEWREEAETMLAGAFIVDSGNAHPNDRIFVISIWAKGVHGAFVDEEVPSINGKSWPFTERMSYQVGETTHWRFLNPTWTDHALHLHGFYFKVDGVGDGDRYERYAEEQRPTAVTEHIDPGHVFELTWTPDRAGNWLFHCHMADHMSPPKYRKHDPRAMSDTAHRNDLGMGGLVLGIAVRASERAVPSPPVSARKLQLVISENPTKVPLYQLAVNDPDLTVKPDSNAPSTTLLGPPIVLRRGEATEIEVKNKCTMPTSIHWHGMEIESYYDGVAGWTGTSDHPSPAILPGTSFVARMTPPRAGTFIYHTHWHDDVQLVNGVYGPLIVLDKGEQYDPEHDRVFVFSAGRYPPFGFILLVNGHPEPDPISLRTATPYRLRLINITDNSADLRVRLLNHGAPVQWKVIAKDGASLPPAQLKLSTADLGITVGETYDVEYQTDTAGLADLEIRETGFPTPVTLPLTFSNAK